MLFLDLALRTSVQSPPKRIAGCPRRSGRNWAGQVFDGSARHDFAAASCVWAKNSRPGELEMQKVAVFHQSVPLMVYPKMMGHLTSEMIWLTGLLALGCCGDLSCRTRTRPHGSYCE